jgi:plasmid stabilization system protein ParE
MADIVLTPEQEAEADRLAELITQRAKEEAVQMARLLVSKADHELLGATEFEVRDRMHRLGAFAVATAVNQRKKGGTAGRA